MPPPDRLQNLPENEPWAIQPGETISHHDLFLAYLRQPHPRSIARLAREVGKSTTTLYTYSSRMLWMQRVRAYDSWEAERVIESDIEEKRRLRREHLRALEKARYIAEDKLRAILEDPESALADMSPKDTLAFLVEAVKWERTITGEVTERIETTQQAVLEQLSDEELEAFETLNKKARGD